MQLNESNEKTCQGEPEWMVREHMDGPRVIAPGKDSGAHHHGEAETGGFILSGQMRILFW